MAFKLAEAFVELSARGFGGVSGIIDKVTGSVSRMGNSFVSLESLLPSVGTMLGALGVSAGVGGMISMAASAESAAVSFEVLLGSASAAEKMLADLRQFAAETPFDFPGLQSATNLLLNNGVAAEEVMKDLDMISNVAAGDSQKLQSLALVFGQISATGRLTGGDLLQLVNAGFNPLQEISQKTGKSIATLREEMSDGLISFDMVKKAFESATSEGGRFYQMNEKQSKTLGGLWSTLGDNVGEIFRDSGQLMVDAFDLKGVLAGAIGFTGGFRNAMQPIITEILPSVSDLMESLSGAFGFAWEQMTGATGTGVQFVVTGLEKISDWAIYLIDTTSFVVDNWGLLWAIAYENAALAFSNIMEVASTWGSNVMEVAGWFLDNWKDIFSDIGQITAVVFTNMGGIVGNAMKSIMLTIAESKVRLAELLGQIPSDAADMAVAGLRVAFANVPQPTGLLDGFESSIKEMPKLAQASVKSTSAELMRLQGLLDLNAIDAGLGLKKPSGVAAFAGMAAEFAKGIKKTDSSTAASGKNGSFFSIQDISKNIQTGAFGKSRSEQLLQNIVDNTGKSASAVGVDGKVKTDGGPGKAG